MEAFGAFLDDEWESLSKLFSNEEDNSDSHVNGSYNLFQSCGEIPSTFLCAGESNGASDHNESNLFIPYDTNLHSISQDSSNSSEIENHQGTTGVNLYDDESMDFYTLMNCKKDNSTMPIFSDDVMEEILQLKAELCEEQLSSSTAEIHHSEADKEMQLKRKHQDNLSQSPKKKPRVPRNKTKKNVQRNKKADDQISRNEEENNNYGVIVNSSSSTSSEDSINNASEDILNSKGKARATRGAATDPQSLYARRRRERINERLKILQNLVPNGTKVDISTMLEEAVHYVKFLQLQIKLLSSDDHWMYAPIAYNGMDMGLYQKIVPNMWTRALSN